MFNKILKSGLRIIFFPTLNNNNSNEFIVRIAFATPIKFPENSTAKTHDILLGYSYSHLIEHILGEQKLKELVNLERKYNCKNINCYTTVNFTYYEFLFRNKKFIKEACNEIYKILFDQKEINEKFMLHELEIIKHENKDIDYQEISPYNLITSEKEYKKVKCKNSTKIRKSLTDKCIEKISNLDAITKYYKKHYTPDNSVIYIDGGDKEVLRDFYMATQDYFKLSPVKSPRVYDFTEDIDKAYDTYINTDNTFYNQIFKNKYYLFPFKDANRKYSELRIYYQIPKSRKFELATDLYLRIINKNCCFESLLLELLREKEKLTYFIPTTFSNIENSNKKAVEFSIKTNDYQIKTALIQLRKTIENIAYNKEIDIFNFKQIKKDFKKEYLEDLYMQECSDENLKNLFNLAFSNIKTFSVERELKIINDLKLEDIINVAKFFAKSPLFTVQCFSNNVTIDDLKVFNNIKQPYSNKDLNKFLKRDDQLTYNQKPTDSAFDAKKEKKLKVLPIIDYRDDFDY